LYGFYLMNKATNVRQFEEGLREITVPGQSVVYADVNGNIACWTTGHVPIRVGHANPMLPIPGWTGENGWHGFVPFEQLPKLLNPPEGFIACANQKISNKHFSYYLSTLWEPPSRLLRIRELLRSAEKFTADDFKQFQQDVVSPFARDVTAQLLHAFDTITVTDKLVADALTYIRNWDFRYTQNDVATTIFSEFFVHLLRNTYADEMGNDVFNDFLFFGAIPVRVTSQLLASDSSAWFDNVTTPLVVETKDDIVRTSFTDAIHELQSKFGNETKTWQWGTVHTVTFKHPFGSRKPLDRVFNIGPFPVGGGGTTVNKTEYRFAAPYDVSVGPSMRQVSDLSQPLAAYTVITSGQSGQPFQKHYDDQTSLWLNGGYKRITTDWSEIRRAGMDHLVLKP
jgi:penicillin amidase